MEEAQKPIPSHHIHELTQAEIDELPIETKEQLDIGKNMEGTPVELHIETESGVTIMLSPNIIAQISEMDKDEQQTLREAIQNIAKHHFQDETTPASLEKETENDTS